MKEVGRIKIIETETLEIERTWYEYNAMLTLVSQFGSDSGFKPDKERYELLLNKYIDTFMEYNIIFNSIINKYLPEGIGQLFSQVDFNVNEIILLEKEGDDINGKCMCACESN